MAEFGGWSMPMDYAGGGVLAEHGAVRQAVGLFDVSHLGKLMITGPGAVDYLNTRLTNDLLRLVPGKAQYNLLCNDSGGVVDDMIAYLISPGQVLLVPNAANAATVAELLQTGAPSDVQVTDLGHALAIFAVQGPRADELLTAVGLPTGLAYMAFAEVGGQTTVCRSGYTGERGYELVVPADQASAWWARLLQAGDDLGARACGLGARDTLRTEMGYALHGNDLSEEIDPVSARVGWAVGWAKPAFDGRQALLDIRAAGPTRRSRGIRAVKRGIPRPGMDVIDPASEQVIGQVTSGNFSPTLRTGIGLALLRSDFPDSGQVAVQVRNRMEIFELVDPPFVESHVR